MTKFRWLLPVLVLAAGLVAPGPAHAADDTLRLVTQTAWVDGTNPFEGSVAVDGDGAVELRVTLHRAVGNRSALARTVEGRSLGRSLHTEVHSLTTVERDAGGNPIIRAETPSVPGVYPVTVELRTADGEVTDRLVTHLVRVPDQAPTGSLAVAWVQPVETADAALTVGAALGGHGPLTLDLTPAALTGLGDQLLEPFRAAIQAGDQLLASPYVTVDPSVLVASGLDDDLALQREVGDEVLFAALSAHGDIRTWVAVRSLTPAAIDRLRALGVTRVVVPERTLEPLATSVTGGTTVTRPFRVEGDRSDALPAVAIDEGSAEHFAATTDPVLAAHQLLADLAFLYFDAPGTERGVVVRPPSGWEPDLAFLDIVLDALEGTSVLRPVTLQTLFDEVKPLSDDGDPVVRTAATSSVRTLPVTRIADARRAARLLVDLLGPASPQAETAQRRLLGAEAAGLTASERDERLQSVHQALGAVRGRLHLPSSRTFRLTAREGTIPVTVVNDNAVRVRVRLVLSSEKLEFIDGRAGDRGRQVLDGVTIAAHSARTITVPVRARASATFTLRASLLTTSGAELGRSQVIIRSTVFSGVGVVLSIGAGLFLLLWWASHWRTVRRARRLVDLPQ
jgi:hypothetical protein